MLSLRQMVLIDQGRAGYLAMPSPTRNQLQIPTSVPTHQTHVELPAVAAAVPLARHHARNALTAWGLDTVSVDAELLISELVTNAVEATAKLPVLAPIELNIAAYPGQLVLQVCDASPELPAERPQSESALNGRGLHIIRSISSAWGFAREPGGKLVWASLGLDQPAA